MCNTDSIKLNENETTENIFPEREFKVLIRSNDIISRHIQVICSSKGCNAYFRISDGNLYHVKDKGDTKTFNYILSNIKPWLKMQSKVKPKYTNQEHAFLAWHSLSKI